MLRIFLLRISICFLVFLTGSVQATLYSYTTSDGDYIVSKNKPNDRDIEYAVLTDEGEFVRLVKGQQPIPIGHWRPWFIPKEPHPLDGRPEEIVEPTPVVSVEEIEKD